MGRESPRESTLTRAILSLRPDGAGGVGATWWGGGRSTDTRPTTTTSKGPFTRSINFVWVHECACTSVRCFSQDGLSSRRRGRTLATSGPVPKVSTTMTVALKRVFWDGHMCGHVFTFSYTHVDVCSDTRVRSVYTYVYTHKTCAGTHEVCVVTRLHTL